MTTEVFRSDGPPRLADPWEPDAPTATRHLLGIDGLSARDHEALLDLAAVMKRHPLAWRNALEGRAVACLFEQRSSRSRVSIDVAIGRLGGHAIVVRPDELQLDSGDSVADTARVLAAYCDAIAVRTHWHRDVLELAEHASVPVINARSDSEHPCRALGDCLTLREHFGDLRGLQLAYVGGRTAVARSLIETAMLSGVEVRVAAPPALLPDPALLARTGATVRLCEDPREAITGANVVYAAGCGDETPDAYRVTAKLLSLSALGAVFMHALPTVRERELHAEVIDGPFSVAPQQTANLLPVTQAVLRALVTGDWEA